jgi:hypothetical protein
MISPAWKALFDADQIARSQAGLSRQGSLPAAAFAAVAIDG